MIWLSLHFKTIRRECIDREIKTDNDKSSPTPLNKAT